MYRPVEFPGNASFLGQALDILMNFSDLTRIGETRAACKAVIGAARPCLQGRASLLCLSFSHEI
jgi:hypothetical protein